MFETQRSLRVKSRQSARNRWESVCIPSKLLKKNRRILEMDLQVK